MVSGLVDGPAAMEFCDPRYEGRVFTVHLTAEEPLVASTYVGGARVLTRTWDLYLNTRDGETDDERLANIKLLDGLARDIAKHDLVLPAGLAYWHTLQTQASSLSGANNEEEVYVASFATIYEEERT
jgi:hypothetical protein